MARPKTLNRGASDERAAIGAWLRRQRTRIKRNAAPPSAEDFIEYQLAWLFGGKPSDTKHQSSRVRRVLGRKGGLRA